MAEKPSHALFTVDTIGSDSIQKAYNKIHKPLKADQILALRSAVPPVNSHKRSRVTDGVIEPNAKKQKKNGISPKEYERLKTIAYGGETVSQDVIKTDGAPEYDPWAPTINDTEQDSGFSYLEKPQPVKAPLTLKEAPISLVAGTGVIPAVTKPKPGISYNPVFQDWDQLLIEEGKKEVEAEKLRLRNAELEKEKLNIISKAQDEIDNVQTEDESAWEGFDSEYEGGEWLKKSRRERKTPAERNKIKRRKIAERQAKVDIEMKRRANQAQQIKNIAMKVEAEAKAIEASKLEVAAVPSEEIDDRILRRRRFGKHS